jgi:multiple sugar transport system substrate-binding protein
MEETVNSLPGSLRHRTRFFSRKPLYSLAAVTAAALLAACGGSQAPPPTTTPSKIHAHLTWWTWENNPQAVVNNFEKHYPNIKVTVSNVGAGGLEYTKLRTVLTAGSGAPDVVQITYDTLPEFIATNKLYNIAPYVSQYKRDFPAWVWGQVSRNGKVYAFPEDIGPMGLIYNSVLLKKYHLGVPATWSAFQQDALQLHKEAPGEYMTASPANPSFSYTLVSLFWQAGAQLFHLTPNGTWQISINNPITRKVLTYWVDLARNRLVDPGTESAVQYNHNISAARYVSYVAAAWEPQDVVQYVTPSHPQHFAVAQLPQWSAGQDVSANDGGSSNAVTDQTSNPQAAALFASFINASPSGISIDASPYSGKNSKGVGLFPADLARASAPGFHTVISDFAPNTNTVFSQAASHVNTSFEWSPWTPILEQSLGTEASLASSGKISAAAALAATQQTIITDAQQAGYKTQVVSK